MTDAELDIVYTRLCTVMTELGETAAPLFLARVALLALTRLDDAGTALKLVDSAAEGLTASPVSA